MLKTKELRLPQTHARGCLPVARVQHVARIVTDTRAATSRCAGRASRMSHFFQPFPASEPCTPPTVNGRCARHDHFGKLQETCSYAASLPDTDLVFSYRRIVYGTTS